MSDPIDPSLAGITKRFGEFLDAADKRFAAYDTKITALEATNTELTKALAAKKTLGADEPDGDEMGPDGKPKKKGPAADSSGKDVEMNAVLGTLKQLTAQVEAAVKVHKFATPPGAAPSDDSASDAAKRKELEAKTGNEPAFVKTVREFMKAGDGKMPKSEAIRKAVAEQPDQHREFTQLGAKGQNALRTL